MSALDDLKSWQGSADELAKRAGEMLAGHGLSDDPVTPNVRLIRNYSALGVVGRPERRNKEAIYRFRHLIEFVAARILVADGWPLAKIAQHIGRLSDAELLVLIPGQEGANPALATARSLMRESAYHDQAVEYEKNSKDLSGASSGPGFFDGPQDAFMHRVARTSAMQSELFSAMKRLGLPPHALPVEQLTLVAIAPWCQVLFESARLQTLTMDEAEEIGRILAARLVTLITQKEPK